MAKRSNQRGRSPARFAGLSAAPACILSVFSSAIITTIITLAALSHQKPAPLPPRDPNLIQIESNEFALGQLLMKTPEQLQGTDIALMNLLCASGLPGTEGVQQNIQSYLKQLDDWADYIRYETTRNLHRFSEHPEEYDNSLAHYKAGMLLTVLQQDLDVKYDPAAIKDQHFPYTNSRQLFIHGLVESPHIGTCASMPVLYTAIGRRLGYPLYFVSARGHFFVRWESSDGKERFDIEGTHSVMFYDDARYMSWPRKIDKSELSYLLKNMTSAEELATFCDIRGNCLEAMGRYSEAGAAYALAHKFAPKCPWPVGWMAQSLALPVKGVPPLVVWDGPFSD